MTLEILCEEFRVIDEIKTQKKQKKIKKKIQRQIKINNEVCYEFLFLSLLKLIYLDKRYSNKNSTR
jgi:hypothetical protein